MLPILYAMFFLAPLSSHIYDKIKNSRKGAALDAEEVYTRKVGECITKYERAVVRLKEFSNKNPDEYSEATKVVIVDYDAVKKLLLDKNRAAKKIRKYFSDLSDLSPKELESFLDKYRDRY